MNEYNEQGEPNGPWEEYYSNGKLYWRGNYVNGKASGLFERYWSDGNLWYKKNYVNGKGLHERYSSNGKLNIKQYWL